MIPGIEFAGESPLVLIADAQAQAAAIDLKIQEMKQEITDKK